MPVQSKRLKFLLYFHCLIMKRHNLLLLFLSGLSLIAGYLLSKVSLVGRMGMTLFYREYNFLKSWWKATGLLLVVFVLIYGLHVLAQKKLPWASARRVYLLSVIFAVIGLYISYDDFRHAASHRLLGERFHIGVYLFWIGWMATSLYFIVQNALDRRLPFASVRNKNDADPGRFPEKAG